jgi:hypothetical protein
MANKDKEDDNEEGGDEDEDHVGRWRKIRIRKVGGGGWQKGRGG